MTDLDEGRGVAARERSGPGKRERLVAAGCEMFYEQGVEATTLADIATAADVPLGNVYYYFKTKDDIIGAVVERQVQNIEETLASLERHRTPAARLKALVAALAAQADLVARYGCPHGTLCTELDKQDRNEFDASRRLIELPLEWTEEQFTQMGRRDAKDLAIELIAAYHGAATLTQVLGQPELMARQARRLNRWIDGLAKGSLV